MKKLILVLLTAAMLWLLAACGSAGVTSGDPEYEAQTITVEGLPEGPQTLSVSDLRQLPQQDLDASYKRTTGLYEEYKMSGPLLADVLAQVGADINDYDGIGVQGRDAYYCLISREVVQNTPDLLLALVIDGEPKLAEGLAPAQLAAQGQFGPYWVKMVDKLILYETVPEKEITSVWVFINLAEGIEPYQYEYYGSQDDAIELEKIFARLDHVDGTSFFTMKSADGFKKDEALNMVKSRYYLKVDGEDAPTNISPYIKLGMNVKNIAWVSSNADAMIFPELLATYMDLKEINGQQGLPLSEILYETEVKEVKTQTFDVLGMDGERVRATGEQLSQGILTINGDGTYSVVWDSATGLEPIANLLRIRLAQ